MPKVDTRSGSQWYVEERLTAEQADALLDRALASGLDAVEPDLFELICFQLEIETERACPWVG